MATHIPTASDGPMTVFNRLRVRRHRDRAAVDADRFDFLFDHIGEGIKDRLLDVTREFSRVLNIGCRNGGLSRKLTGHRGIETVFQMDVSPRMASAAGMTGQPTVAGDEEWNPFGRGTMDLVVSALSLHWVNDLPGALVQINHVLKPDGLFLGAMLGGDTLIELRHVILQTEIDMLGGMSPRMSPLADIRDAGALLQRGGFALPVADVETVTVTYDNVFGLLRDLRGMGETQSGMAVNPAILPRAFWPEVAKRYADAHGQADGRIPATFQILYLTGWSPHESQQKPLQPGAARSRLADVLDTTEIPANDKAPRGFPA